MLFAVATENGRDIDRHFGHADRFAIFEVHGAEVRQVGERTVDRYCSADEDHPLRGDVLQAIAKALEGCRAIVCARIGTAPREEMTRLGFEVYPASGEIRATLVELAKLF